MRRRLIFVSVKGPCATEPRTARSYWRSQWQRTIVSYSPNTTLTGGTRSTIQQNRLERSSGSSRETRILTKGHTTSRVPVKDRNGKLITDALEQLQLWVEHFSSVLRVSDSSQNITNQPELRVNRINRATSTAPTLNEIEGVIQNLRSVFHMF